MNKVIRDGQVAVIYSPGYGAGWYTWNDTIIEDSQRLLFDPEIVKMIEENRRDEIEAYADRVYGEDGYWSTGDLQVAWVPQGEEFMIKEYDGYESVILLRDLPLIKA